MKTKYGVTPKQVGHGPYQLARKRKLFGPPSIQPRWTGLSLKKLGPAEYQRQYLKLIKQKLTQ